MNEPCFDAPARFGAVLGYAPGGVPVYSCHYESADDRELPDRHSYRSYVDGIYMGYKWQCVELARRWLYVNHGCIFDEVGMAYEVFELTSLRDLRTNTRRPLRAFRNGSRRHPEPGCLLVWDEGGEFGEVVGHAADFVEEDFGFDDAGDEADLHGAVGVDGFAHEHHFHAPAASDNAGQASAGAAAGDDAESAFGRGES